MARMPRIVVPSRPHHVTQRGTRSQKTFFFEGDYRFYIRLMAEFTTKTDTAVWAYCLMPNHVHMVMVPSSQDGLRATLAEVHRRYARFINKREGWQGHLWQERYHSCPMDESHLLAAVRYIEMNPVSANICHNAGDWPWSSARAHLNGRDDSLVSVLPMLKRIDNWSNYLMAPVDEKQQCRIQQHASSGRPLGDDDFMTELSQITGRDLAVRKARQENG